MLSKEPIFDSQIISLRILFNGTTKKFSLPLNIQILQTTATMLSECLINSKHLAVPNRKRATRLMTLGLSNDQKPASNNMHSNIRSTSITKCSPGQMK